MHYLNKTAEMHNIYVCMSGTFTARVVRRMQYFVNVVSVWYALVLPSNEYMYQLFIHGHGKVVPAQPKSAWNPFAPRRQKDPEDIYIRSSFGGKTGNDTGPTRRKDGNDDYPVKTCNFYRRTLFLYLGSK